jgi:N-sulfoglucosamine sulfohydrolase
MAKPRRRWREIHARLRRLARLRPEPHRAAHRPLVRAQRRRAQSQTEKSRRRLAPTRPPRPRLRGRRHRQGRAQHLREDHGFDYIEGPNPGFAETTAVAKFLATRDRAKPLCLFVGTRHPHTVWSADRTYDPAAVKIPPTHVDTIPSPANERASYLTDVTKADTLLGEVRALARENLSADTLFIYTADHGAAWPFREMDALRRRHPHFPAHGVARPPETRHHQRRHGLLARLAPDVHRTRRRPSPRRPRWPKSFAGILRGTATAHRDRVFATHSGDGE